MSADTLLKNIRMQVLEAQAEALDHEIMSNQTDKTKDKAKATEPQPAPKPKEVWSEPTNRKAPAPNTKNKS